MSQAVRDGTRGTRSLVGCLVYLAGGLLLVLAACSFGLGQVQQRALAQGMSELSVSDFDDTGREIGSHSEPISAESAQALQQQALHASIAAGVALVVAFALRGVPWSRPARIPPEGSGAGDAPRTAG